MINTERESLESIQIGISLMGKKIDLEMIKELDKVLPGMIHLNNKNDIGLEFCGRELERIFDLNNEEIIKDGFNNLMKIAHPETVQDLAGEIIEYFKEKEHSDQMSFFQRLKDDVNDDKFKWWFTTTKGFGDSSSLLSLSFDIKSTIKIGNQLHKLLDDNLFIRKNFTKFSRLTKREKEVLKFLAIGKTGPEISEILFISKNTVRTHRQRIFEKLQVKTFTELHQFAFHFDLL
ncbi:helix-turn-helix transcriptional regulator [Ekhidna sp.]|uniref:helix-turn-helix transcriptional regulator n=1 Tax=Ekhidna sp. TaxID=2608089 RepID=UPI0035187497